MFAIVLRAFSGPLDTEATLLSPDTYTYNANNTPATSNQNVHPYVTIVAVTVPEPGLSALLGFAGFTLLRRRRWA